MISQRSFILLISVGTLTFQSPAAEPAPIAYDFSKPRTNAYRVTVESPSESGAIKLQGTILVGIPSPSEEAATLFIHGRLAPALNAAQPMANIHMHMNPMGRFGPARNPWLMQTHLLPFPNANQAQVDTTGRILRITDSLDLPRPVESYASLLFPRLPDDPAKESQFESEVTVSEESNLPQHMQFHRGPNGPFPSRLTGIRKETSRLLDQKDGPARLHRTLEFRSFLKTEDLPRLAYSYKGEFVFDPADGFVKSATLEGTASTATLDFIQRFPVKLQLERLEGEAFEKALAQLPSTQPRTLAQHEFEKVIEELKGDDTQRRDEAASKLMNIDLSSTQAEKLLPVMMPLLDDPDHMIRMLAARTLASAATPEHVPLLLKMLKQEDTGQQHEVIQALGRLKEKRAIQPLADMIAYGSNSAHSAAQALAEFGPVVEDTALALLQEKHAETRRHACEILSRSGTAKSIEPLQQLIGAGDPNLIHNATEALRSIRMRGEEAAKQIL